MKRISVKHVLYFFAFFFYAKIFLGQPIKIWESKKIFSAPESAVFDGKRNLLYVSNFNKYKPGMYYGKDFISKLNINGDLIKLDWIKNLTAPTGICIYNDKLYIVERFGVVEYDLAADSVSNKYFIKTDQLLNDITVDSDSNIYVSESSSNIIYKIKNDKVEKWLESDEIAKTNGLLFDNNKIIAGVNGDSCLKAIDVSSKEIKIIAKLKSGIIDGIKKYRNDYLVSHFEGNLYLISNDGIVKELLDTRKERVYYADFEYIESKGLLVVPELWNNKITFYSFKLSD